MHNKTVRSPSRAIRLAVLCALTGAGAAHADAPESTPNMTGAGAEGTDIAQVIVQAEKDSGAAAAPTKASLDETQPESIISHTYIELATPETGDWTSVVQIAPSVSGITSNGGNIGEYNKLTMRGFQDGQFNITYDGISFGDTNDPTHHSASYFPASTIGAVVVDRGPGEAGDMGQANYGGAIHFFSPEVSDSFGLQQKLTGASFGTYAAVTTLNTGTQSLLGGGKLLLNFDERTSDGELSYSGGSAYNQLLKYILPLGDNWTVTLFGSYEYTYFHLADSDGPGETWQQVVDYGKDFALTDTFGSEQYTGWNHEAKRSDFEYADIKGTLAPTWTLEDQAYTYFYSNETISSNSTVDLVGAPQSTSLINRPTGTELASDIGGYNKLNRYRVFGDILRINHDFGFGTLKAGGLVEGSDTNRHNWLIDLTDDGAPDLKYTAAKYPLLTDAPTNMKLNEDSTWFQGQVFADFEWNVTDDFKVTPGFKYVSFRRSVDASNENTTGGSKNQPLSGENTYTKPLYFLTANYKILPVWSVYAQAATSFLIPSLSDLYVTGVTLQNLEPSTVDTYQLGTVYSHGAFTADADVYRANAKNIDTACFYPQPTGPELAGYCNVGAAQYQGIEGEAAWAMGNGLSFFINGSINKSVQQATAANIAAGIAASPEQDEANAPRSTLAVGALYNQGSWQGSITYKRSGEFTAGYVGTTEYNLPGYDTLDLAGQYSFGRVKLKLQLFNLMDKRAITTINGFGSEPLYSTADVGSTYQFQAGREFQGTVTVQLF